MIMKKQTTNEAIFSKIDLEKIKKEREKLVDKKKLFQKKYITAVFSYERYHNILIGEYYYAQSDYLGINFNKNRTITNLFIKSPVSHSLDEQSPNKSVLSPQSITLSSKPDEELDEDSQVKLKLIEETHEESDNNSLF